MNPSNLVALLEKDLEYAISQDDQDIRETVLAGLNWCTPNYWPDLALKWLEQGFVIDSEIVEILKRIKDNKIYSQKTRHRAQALVVKWSRESENT